MPKKTEVNLFEFCEYFKTHTLADTCKYFHVNGRRGPELLRACGLENHTADELKTIRKRSGVKKNTVHWFTNGTVDKMCSECPDGFWPGRIVSDEWRKNNAEASSECHWYNNGVNESFTKTCPSGWVPGRLPFSEEFSKNQSISLRSYWDNIPEDEYKKQCSSRSIGINNMSNSAKIAKAEKLSYKKKLWWKNATVKQLIHMRKTLEETLTSNGINQWHSIEEDNLYQQLLGKFPDIVRQYRKDPRYPFFCDFYVPSKDLFIEYNGYWMHGPHPFNECSQTDIDILNYWRSKQDLVLNNDGVLVKNSYYKAEECWTTRDLEKINYAIKNKLNYILIYPNNIYIWEKGDLIHGKNR